MACVCELCRNVMGQFQESGRSRRVLAALGSLALLVALVLGRPIL